MNVCSVWYTEPRSMFCFSTLSRSTLMKTCGTAGANIGVTEASSFRSRAAATNFITFCVRKATSRPARSCSMKVTPPLVPMPGIAGGEKANARAAGTCESAAFT